MSEASERDSFVRLVDALEPYRDVLVFVSGWAYRLFRHPELAGTPDFEPLATDDADIAAPLRLDVRQDSLAALLRRAGFHEEFGAKIRRPTPSCRGGRGFARRSTRTCKRRSRHGSPNGSTGWRT